MTELKGWSSRWRHNDVRGWLISALILGLFGCSKAPQTTTWHGQTMGTTYQVTIAEEVGDPVSLRQAVEHELERLVATFSTYADASEVSRFNRAQTTAWWPVSRELYELAAKARTISQMTEGAFDITIGRLVRLWGFGPAAPRTTPPEESEIQAALATSGYTRLEIRADPPALRKRAPELEIDFSGIAKGHAVDRIGALLMDQGYRNWMVEIGGEISTRGSPAGGERPWQIAIDDGVRDAFHGRSTIDVGSTGIATSGNYFDTTDIAGETYSHVLDPRTGRPSRNRVSAATVVHRQALMADALATACMVIDSEQALIIAETRGWVVRLIREDAHGYEVMMSRDARRFFVEHEH